MLVLIIIDWPNLVKTAGTSPLLNISSNYSLRANQIFNYRQKPGEMTFGVGSLYLLTTIACLFIVKQPKHLDFQQLIELSL